jgi:hypothetical protein
LEKKKIGTIQGENRIAKGNKIKYKIMIPIVDQILQHTVATLFLWVNYYPAHPKALSLEKCPGVYVTPQSQHHW